MGARIEEENRLLQIKLENERAQQRLHVVQHKFQMNTELLDNYDHQTKIIETKVHDDQANLQKMTRITQTYELPTVRVVKKSKITRPDEYRSLMDPDQYMQAFNMESEDLMSQTMSTSKISGSKTRVKVNQVQTMSGGDHGLSIRTISGNVVGNVQEMKTESQRVTVKQTSQVKRISQTTVIDHRNGILLADQKVFGHNNTPDVSETRTRISKVRIVNMDMRRLNVRRNLLV